MELVELAPEPASGRVFERELLPGIADASGEGRCRLDAIARWLQDIAYADLIDAGFEGRGAWVVRRTRIKAQAFPRFGKQVTLRTWCSGLGRFSAERRTSIRGDSGRVDSVSLWICLDLDRGRPMRFPPDFVEAYSETAAGRDANVRLRHPEPPEGAERSPWRFRASEIDPAGHVNNSHYWVPLEEEIAAEPEPGEIDAEIEYRDPATAGEAVLLRADPGLWVASPDGAIHASLLRA